MVYSFNGSVSVGVIKIEQVFIHNCHFPEAIKIA